MELRPEDLKYIKNEISRGKSIEEILTSEFPGARVVIIRGFDEFSSEAYTKGLNERDEKNGI